MVDPSAITMPIDITSSFQFVSVSMTAKFSTFSPFAFSLLMYGSELLSIIPLATVLVTAPGNAFLSGTSISWDALLLVFHT